VLELPADDTLAREAQVVAVEDKRPFEVVRSGGITMTLGCISPPFPRMRHSRLAFLVVGCRFRRRSFDVLVAPSEDISGSAI
jgi:hypothetical protein